MSPCLTIPTSLGSQTSRVGRKVSDPVGLARYFTDVRTAGWGGELTCSCGRVGREARSLESQFTAYYSTYRARLILGAYYVCLIEFVLDSTFWAQPANLSWLLFLYLSATYLKETIPCPFILWNCLNFFLCFSFSKLKLIIQVIHSYHLFIEN